MSGLCEWRRGSSAVWCRWLAALTLMGTCGAGCASQDSTRMILNAGQAGLAAGQITVPVEAAKKCVPAALPPLKPTAADLRAFGLIQTGKLEVCEERRALAVEAMNLHNTTLAAAVKELRPKRWWEFWR